MYFLNTVFWSNFSLKVTDTLSYRGHTALGMEMLPVCLGIYCMDLVEFCIDAHGPKYESYQL